MNKELGRIDDSAFAAQEILGRGRIMDWDKLRIFHAVAEADSFKHAGEILNLSQSAVSRQIGALEESLNVVLFHRHARGVHLTEQGELLYHTAREMWNRLRLTEARLTDAREKPEGELRVTTTVGFGATWLTPRIKEFLELYPDMRVTLTVADAVLDLSMGEADVAIRMRAPTQPDLIQRKLVTVRYYAFASREYLARHGIPETVGDLGAHTFVGYGESRHLPVTDLNWLLYAGADPSRPRETRLKVNNVYALLLAAESGLGIASLPNYMVQGNEKLVRVLPTIDGPTTDTYFVYPEEIRASKRIGIFRDFLIDKVREWEF